MFCIEALEERTLLSWPSAPFAPRQIDGVIYTNQYGYADATGKTIVNSSQTDIYALPIVPGTLKVNSSGSTAVDLAYYRGAGQPTQTDSTGHLSVQTPTGTPLVYLGIAGHQGATGAYGFVVTAPKPKSEVVKTSQNSARVRSQIVGTGDYRIFSFTAPQSGQWKFTVVPGKSLDASMMIFNNGGDPLGTTYLMPINASGKGGNESWSGKLRAGARFAIRVDGQSGSGAFSLHVDGPQSSTPVPTGKATVTVTAPRPAASEVGPKSGQFKIARTGSTAKPLVVQYTLSGSAKNGVDYVKLGGSATIPAGASSTLITIKPLQDRLVEGTESVVLTLKPAAGYAVGSQSFATVSIADAPAASTWPKAPFVAPKLAETLYMNQNGDATVTGQKFSSADDFKAYLVYWDDPTDIVVTATGTAKLEMALYQRTGQPKFMSGTGQISTHVAGKYPIYIGVRPTGNSARGTFSVQVHGIGQGAGRGDMRIDPKTYSATFATTISNTWDSDFYGIITPISGIWRVSIDPTPRPGWNNLDATMNVFNAAGEPIGGTFTDPINAAGEGAPEVWIAKLKANTQIYVRADGYGTSTGWYYVRVQRIGPATVDIAPTVPNAKEAGPTPGQFTITRSGVHDPSQPLTVNFNITGSAQNGVDYQSIAASATIPAGKASVSIDIAPIADQQVNPDRSVILTLLRNPNYVLGAQAQATVTISET